MRPGQHVLVTGACSTAKADLVRAIGADHVLDYTRADITAGPQRYDVIIDMAGDRPLARMRQILAPTGTLVLTGGKGSAWLGPMTRNLRAQVLSAIARQKQRYRLPSTGPIRWQKRPPPCGS